MMKDIQKKVEKFCTDNSIKTTPESRMLDVVSEVGEVAKEILLMTDYGKMPIKKNQEIKTELGDLFFSLITLANHFDVDLEEMLTIALDKYEKRLRKGSAGSEVEKT